MVLLTGALLVSLAACGDDASDSSAGQVTDGTVNDAGADDAAGDAGASIDDGLGEEFECTITAEQVGEVLGAQVERNEGTCAFSPGAATGRQPTAAFLGQLAELCEGDFVEQNGYTEPVEGLGVDAYLKPGTTASAEIWVCAPAPFVVAVGVGPDLGRSGAVAAAETLALVSLEG